jgi:long-chain acyl-CoA synthetase
VISADTVDALAAGTAIQAIGGAAVYLRPDTSAEELAAKLTQADVTHVLAQDQEQCDKIIDSGVTGVSRVIYAEPRGLSDYLDARLVSLTEVEKEGQALLAKDDQVVRRRLAAVGPDEVASIVFTAGLVQPARPVGLSHRHLMDAAGRLTLAFPIRAGASYFLSTPLTSAMSQYVAMAVAPSLPLVVNMPERPSSAAS